jgi:hypothetical protein
MLTYADVWMQHEVFRLLLAMEDLRMLTYADICWHMLTYADVRMQHEVFRLLRAMEDLHGLPYSKLALSARQLSGES